jgi:hypothetical protein
MKRILSILAMAILVAAPPVTAGVINDGTITVTGTAQSISSVPNDCDGALITVSGDAVRIGFKTAPTATTGHRLAAGDSLIIDGCKDVHGLQVIHDSGASGAKLDYSIFGVGGD